MFRDRCWSISLVNHRGISSMSRCILRLIMICPNWAWFIGLFRKNDTHRFCRTKLFAVSTLSIFTGCGSIVRPHPPNTYPVVTMSYKKDTKKGDRREDSDILATKPDYRSSDRSTPLGTVIAAPTARCVEKFDSSVSEDTNNDKISDVEKHYRTRLADSGKRVHHLVCKAADLNTDGVMDAWFHYNTVGDIVREELDSDYDGRVDLVSIREANRIVTQEIDSNGDGRVDEWRRYERNQVSLVDRDIDFDGTRDSYEYYVDGHLRDSGNFTGASAQELTDK